jgi:hypothetical protein
LDKIPSLLSASPLHQSQTRNGKPEFMSDPLFALVVIAVLIVVGILVLGLTGFGKGSGKLHSNSNRLMRYRIIGQAVAVGLIVIYVYLKRQGG